MSSRDLLVDPIGIVHSPWSGADGTPIQSFVSWHLDNGWQKSEVDRLDIPFKDRKGGRGTLEVHDRWREALRDLDGFTHLWAIFWIDRSSPPEPTVIPYRDTVRRGLFATRTPSRPNPIGLSCLRIVSVVGRCVHVSGLDILDGSPLIDIKPYIPDYDSFRTASRGWLEGPSSREEVVAADDRFYEDIAKSSR
ncbi:MAG TPA: tRNA (N6-threonylcarbamoyladenosine(37)-N6)-methyltransferase TrmO [Fibrobacteria bacterium]|nr:tRNA (N6-threonylcarbamoyladenosine(37)-N6)-methyltransferase TrmO [Fibrobacteria bacterium]HOX50138.1 tRNA (N6-threonylcarbamoyladenosine(37)-N6)-methyltransferase TrmO [Fibrobacteria bacterium]